MSNTKVYQGVLIPDAQTEPADIEAFIARF